MATASGDQARASLWPTRVLSGGFGILATIVVGLWLVEIVDTVALGDRLQTNGIKPRRFDGLDGIAWAPFLHSTFGHVASNSVPFLALGFLVMLRGLRHWLVVTLAVVVGGGALTWLLGGSGNHIGASGVVFGYFGALLGAAFYERRPRTIAPALVAILLYSGMVAGLVPRTGISWEGHLFGLVAGVLAARQLADRRPERKSPPDEGAQYPWELDEPWLEP
jgi:membrane associated rhomboid family serine protease